MLPGASEALDNTTPCERDNPFSHGACMDSLCPFASALIRYFGGLLKSFLDLSDRKRHRYIKSVTGPKRAVQPGPLWT